MEWREIEWTEAPAIYPPCAHARAVSQTRLQSWGEWSVCCPPAAGRTAQTHPTPFPKTRPTTPLAAWRGCAGDGRARGERRAGRQLAVTAERAAARTEMPGVVASSEEGKRLRPPLARVMALTQGTPRATAPDFSLLQPHLQAWLDGMNELWNASIDYPMTTEYTNYSRALPTITIGNIVPEVNPLLGPAAFSLQCVCLRGGRGPEGLPVRHVPAAFPLPNLLLPCRRAGYSKHRRGRSPSTSARCRQAWSTYQRPASRFPQQTGHQPSTSTSPRVRCVCVFWGWEGAALGRAGPQEGSLTDWSAHAFHRIFYGLGACWGVGMAWEAPGKPRDLPPEHE